MKLRALVAGQAIIAVAMLTLSGCGADTSISVPTREATPTTQLYLGQYTLVNKYCDSGRAIYIYDSYGIAVVDKAPECAAPPTTTLRGLAQ